MADEQTPPSAETDPASADLAAGPTAAPRRRVRRPAAAGSAVRMTEARGTEMFPADDPRAGAYAHDKVYRVPEDVDQAVAEALVAGGGYEWTERPAEPAGDQ